MFKMSETVFIGNARQCFYRQCFLQEVLDTVSQEYETVFTGKSDGFLQGMPDCFAGNARDCYYRKCQRQCFYRECQTVFLQGMSDSVFMGNIWLFLQEMSENVFMWNGRHCFTWSVCFYRECQTQTFYGECEAKLLFLEGLLDSICFKQHVSFAFSASFF